MLFLNDLRSKFLIREKTLRQKIVTVFTILLLAFFVFKILEPQDPLPLIDYPQSQPYVETPGIGIRATLRSLDRILVKSPELSKTGKSFITANKMGFDTVGIDFTWVAEEFIKFCQEHPGEYVLDVGAGYGFLTREALSKGMFVIANDIELQHLLYCRKKVRNPYEMERLYLNKNPFPYLDIPKNSLSAVIFHRVLSYLSGDKIDLGLKNINYWLKKGGKIYIMVLSMEHIAYREHVLPEYEKRKRNGDPWPGMYLDVPKYLPDQAYTLPEKLHIIDKEIMQKALERHGFEIERIGYVSMQGFSQRADLDGKEAVGVIAIKKVDSY